MIYLDYSATTPISEQALQIYLEVAKNYYGNPNSLHDIGGQAAQLLEGCRAKLATLIQAESRGVFFTGGGSEANELAIRSLVKGNDRKGRRLITTKVEHASVLNTFIALEEEGYEVVYAPVDEYGQVDLVQLEALLTEDTILVSICHANSEIGTIQPLEQIGELLTEKKHIIFHSDCIQSFGKIPIDVQKAKVDSISLSSHKIYGPKGVGACYISPSVSWKSVLPHISHEKGFRQGSVNLPGIAGFVTAAEETVLTLGIEKERVRRLTQQLLEGLRQLKWEIVLEGHPKTRLPHHLGLRILGMEGQYAMLECNRYGVAISTGTACLAHEKGSSETMQAIGKTDTEANEFIRLTLGKETTEEEVTQTIKTIDQICQQYFKR
ncbi:IscS subfamily cysteine desulfurase [Bacillus horti]|uniref:Cysteine desulfurase n=1 Tax=Caldalkalibacillus horti TaxID=77523 RepID=A0ABT9VVR9_9BACI|nr:IscS subfamily cysteine desulfurase [Bacillus horti]MDQ0165073.1 cysteine desulfurase [Bacillus horti]